MKRKITPNKIVQLWDNEVFVFGSNSEGKHDGGAALMALNNFGAIYGQSSGMQGKSYGINTMSGYDEMEKGLDQFIEFAKNNPNLLFYMTRIGLGIAGLDKDIVYAMFFRKDFPLNVALPYEFIKEYNKKNIFSSKKTKEPIWSKLVLLLIRCIDWVQKKTDSIYLKNVKCTLNSITYSDYIDFICDNRYKSMLKSNIYTPIRIIMQGFALLMEEYNETSSAPDIRTEESKKKQRQSLTEKYQLIYLCYMILQERNCKEATERLVSMMVVQDSDDRLTMLKKCEATMKGLKFQRDQLKAAKKEQKPMTRKDYTAEFNRLQKWYGQMIPKSISMSDYVAIQNEYISYCEDLKRQKEQRNG